MKIDNIMIEIRDFLYKRKTKTLGQKLPEPVIY